MTNIITFKGLYDAYRECRKRKRQSANTQCYEMALLDNVFETLEALQQKRYTPTRSIRFMVKKPKAREIYAADFSDRVVHHWLVPRLEAIFEPVFIHDVYSNRKGKGIHAAVKRLQGFMQAVSQEETQDKPSLFRQQSSTLSGLVHPEWSQREGRGFTDNTFAVINSSLLFNLPLSSLHICNIAVAKRNRLSSSGWFLQLDIANFFNTIDKPILFKRLQKGLSKALKQKKISKEELQTLRWLCHVLLKHDATIEAEYRGKSHLTTVLPQHKKLGNIGKDKGLAIGNLTSQFFANVYLNPLDQYIKHNLKCRYYCRYVDDFVLLADNPETLLQWREKIIHFLDKECQLRLKALEMPQRVTSGADFLGYITFPHHRLVRRRVVGNCREKLHHVEKQLLRGNLENGYKLVLSSSIVEGLRATLNSYWAHFQHANSYRLRKGLLGQFVWLGLLFEVDALLTNNAIKQKNNQTKHLFIKACWEAHPSAITGYKSQIRFFQTRFPCATLSVQRGTQIDRFDPQVAPPLPSAKVPIHHNVSQVHINQQGTLKGGLKRRCVQTLFIQPGVELCHHH